MWGLDGTRTHGSHGSWSRVCMYRKMRSNWLYFGEGDIPSSGSCRGNLMTVDGREGNVNARSGVSHL
jgi:hypothetical protein